MLGECCLPLGTGDDACSVKGSRFFRGPFCVLTCESTTSSCIMREKSLRFAELAQVESTGCFQRKRGLPSSRLTKAGQSRVAIRSARAFWLFCGTFSGVFSPANVQNH